jgi:hypothetical protein
VALTIALLATASTATDAQSFRLSDRIVSSFAASYPFWKFDPQSSQPRQSPLSTAEQQRSGRSTIWVRRLVWRFGPSVSSCFVYPSLREAEIAVRNLREAISVAVARVPGAGYDITFAGRNLQLRRGRVVAQLGGGEPEARQLADIIVQEVDRDPELLRDSVPGADRYGC